MKINFHTKEQIKQKLEALLDKINEARCYIMNGAYCEPDYEHCIDDINSELLYLIHNNEVGIEKPDLESEKTESERLSELENLANVARNAMIGLS